MEITQAEELLKEIQANPIFFMQHILNVDMWSGMRLIIDSALTGQPCHFVIVVSHRLGLAFR